MFISRTGPLQAYSCQMRRICLSQLLLAVLTVSVILASAQPDHGSNPETVPVIDGGIGPCSADFTVTDAEGSPVYAAKIKVHIAYGFMYARKLDLEVGTNSDGKASFVGLPDRVKHGLFFEASEGDRTANAFDDPAITCKAHFALALRKKP